MDWIKHPVILRGEKVKLLPLEREHFPFLVAAASHKEIWQYSSIEGFDKDKMLFHLKSLVLKRASAEVYPFTVVSLADGNIIGSTSFLNISAWQRQLEIGDTWYHPAHWRTGINRECKLLMLAYCFESLNAVRVQLVADEENMRSRNALSAIGAKLEGTLRKNRLRSDGSIRNTAVYSIIDEEWAGVKATLIAANARYGL